LPEHLALLADLSSTKGDLPKADELFSEATDVINGLLVNVNTQQLKSSLIATRTDAYVGHFRLLGTKMSDPYRAFQVIEEARGRAVADALRGQSESLSEADGTTIGARREISRTQLELLHETDPKRRRGLLDVLFAFEQLLLPVRKEKPDSDSSLARMTPVDAKVLQFHLRSDEVLLEYVLDEPQSLCLRVTATGLEVVTLPGGRKEIESLVEEYLEAVRSRRSEVAASQKLFSILLAPVLGGLRSYSRVLVVPDGKLHLLPIDALRDADNRYVLESHTVTLAPSATALVLLRKDRDTEPVKMSFLGVGGVPYAGGAATVRTSALNSDADFFGSAPVTFGDLPGSKQEIAGVAHLLPMTSKLLLGNEATEANFKALPLADYSLIHLAVHGVASPQFPERASLVLGSSKRANEDGLLQAREIRELPLKADLVVLSACETGSGRLLGEEGIASLERAFLFAGARSVVASLWTADDTFTITLMKRFYQHLARGLDKASALRQAKLDVLKDYGDQALPIYWAGFTLVGDGSRPVFSK
jgi:CHAT domain-containing protein